MLPELAACLWKTTDYNSVMVPWFPQNRAGIVCQRLRKSPRLITATESDHNLTVISNRRRRAKSGSHNNATAVSSETKRNAPVLSSHDCVHLIWPGPGMRARADTGPAACAPYGVAVSHETSFCSALVPTSKRHISATLPLRLARHGPGSATRLLLLTWHLTRSRDRGNKNA